MKTFTVNSLATLLGVEYAVAGSIIKVIVATGQGMENGKVKTSLTGKGKPSTTYSLPDQFTLDLTGAAAVTPDVAFSVGTKFQEVAAKANLKGASVAPMSMLPPEAPAVEAPAVEAPVIEAPHTALVDAA